MYELNKNGKVFTSKSVGTGPSSCEKRIYRAELKKNGKVFTSKFVGTGPSSYENRIYRDAVSQRLRNTDIQD